MSKVTGGLYRCDMDSPDCTRVDFDNEGEISADICVILVYVLGYIRE